MISFELAKELKKAGFTQDRSVWLYDRDGDLCVRMYKAVFDGSEMDAPDLSELIEACGKLKFELVYAEAGWMARTRGEAVYGWATPDEAVARLWLALHADAHRAAA